MFDGNAFPREEESEEKPLMSHKEFFIHPGEKTHAIAAPHSSPITQKRPDVGAQSPWQDYRKRKAAGLNDSASDLDAPPLYTDDSQVRPPTSKYWSNPAASDLPEIEFAFSPPKSKPPLYDFSSPISNIDWGIEVVPSKSFRKPAREVLARLNTRTPVKR